MESLQRMPSKITNAYMKLQALVNEIETQIRQFTELPSDTPDIHLLAKDIVQNFVVLRNKFTAETITHESLPDDLLEIEAKLRDLEAEFYRSNVDSNFAIGDHDHEDDVSENGSVCESCLNYDEDEVMVSPEEKVEEAVISPERVEETTAEVCKKSGKRRRRRWWWRTVVILMPASVVWAVCYFDMKQHEGFLVPT